MTDGGKRVAEKAAEVGRDLAPEVLVAFKRVVKAHGKMVGAKAILRGIDAVDPAYPEAVDDDDVARGLFKQAVELEALSLGKEALAALLVAFGEMVG